MDYTDRLRRLAINDEGSADEAAELDSKTLALVRLAALVAIGAGVPSYGAQSDAAVDAGATTAEIVAVLVGIVPTVGLPRVVAAAPKLAAALGYEIDDALEAQSSGDR